ncbi:MAG: glycosyltransferase family 1 protein [Anaerolineales bacterium]|nr:glycosyltransferase family 1 protein [Anaerolineales bacterium]
MRIALFTETFLPKVDGIVNTLCYLLDYLAAAGHDSILFAPGGDRERVAATPVIGYAGVRFPLYPELRLVPPTVPIRAPLAAFRPDVVHVLNPLSLGVAGMWQARRLGAPVVASYHTDIAGFAARWGYDALSSPIWHVLRAIHNQADLTLCPSRATLAELQARGFARLQVWSRGVDTARFHPRRRSAAWRQRLSGGDVAAPLLLFVSRLSPEKRADWLLPVLQALPQARLAIVGDGPARPALEKLFAGTRTVFTGYLHGESLARAYAAADVFVFPAANETLGNVVLEAMASGLPVVAARSGGPLDVMVDGHNGWTFAPDDGEGLVTAVRRLLADPAAARALGQNARQQMEARSWARVFDTLLADYEALVQAHGAKRPWRRGRRRQVAAEAVPATNYTNWNGNV